MTPFDHLKNLHTKKRKWKDFNDEEKKNFNIYIINKALSFNPNYLFLYYLLNLDFINGLKVKMKIKTKIK